MPSCESRYGSLATDRHDASQPHQEFPELVLTHDGAPVTGATVRIEKRHSSDGVTLIVRVQQGDKDAVAEVPRADTMSDDALGAAIASQLLAAGLDMTVKVSGEQIEIRPRAAK